MRHRIVEVAQNFIDNGKPGDCKECAMALAFRNVIADEFDAKEVELSRSGVLLGILLQDKEGNEDDLDENQVNGEFITAKFYNNGSDGEIKAIFTMSPDLEYWIEFFDQEIKVRPIDINIQKTGEYKGVPVFEADLNLEWINSLDPEDYLFLKNEEGASYSVSGEGWEFDPMLTKAGTLQ